VLWEFACEALLLIDDNYVRVHHYFEKDLRPVYRINDDVLDASEEANNTLIFNKTYSNYHYLEATFTAEVVGLYETSSLIFYTARPEEAIIGLEKSHVMQELEELTIVESIESPE